MNNSGAHILLRGLLAGCVCFYISASHSAQPINNGNFETGDLSGWFTASTNDAKVLIANQGSCFSANDTTSINVREGHAALLRSNSNGDSDSVAILRSDAFNAGDGFAFIALSETTPALSLKEKDTTELVVEILDATDDSVIASQLFSTGQAALNPGCPSTGSAGQFTSHYFSTRAYAGRGIKIQFKQSTRIKGSAFFTLIDQVVQFNQGEHPSFYSRPHAQAGMKLTSFGIPMLTSKGSFDPDHKLFDLGYTWYVNDQIFELRNPCIAGFSNGNYEAVLFVNDGHHAMSDSVSFHINQLANPISGTSTASTTSTDTVSTDDTTENTPVATVSDPECDVQVALYDDESEYEVPINDPDNLFVDTANQNVVDNVTTTTEQTTSQTSFTSSSTESAYDLRASGIVWKPVSEGDGKLVVLTPSQFSVQKVSILNSQGSTIESATFVGRTNGDRATYRFNLSGGSYARNSILRVGNTDYLVSNPASRVN